MDILIGYYQVNHFQMIALSKIDLYLLAPCENLSLYTFIKLILKKLIYNRILNEKYVIIMDMLLIKLFKSYI